MAEPITFDALRGLEEPARVKIIPNEGRPQVFFQITGPRDVGALCRGRAVEELPRILSILSPAHHLVSALAMDNLFEVEPPPLAVNMREALLQTLFFANHLRKIYFLISSRFNPLLFPLLQENGPSGDQPSPHILDEIMGHVAIAQEAVTILGGRPDHPLSAIVGGVSRFLKGENYERLSQIAASCLEFSIRLGETLGREMLGEGKAFSELSDITIPPLPFLTASVEEKAIILSDETGKESDRFSADQIFQKIGLHKEPWSYEPFAYLKGSSGSPDLKDLVGIQDLSRNQCFFVGPLARLNRDMALTPLAEENRQRLLKESGPLPHLDLSSTYWSLFLEILQSAEKMTGLFQQEKLTGPETRTIPTAMGREGRREGRAVLESPRGLIYHHYTVDEKGLVKDIAVLDTATENNALRCLLAQKCVERGLSEGKNKHQIKKDLEMVLLPF
jgi:F420-non-reducing hydrogenase large subunit